MDTKTFSNKKIVLAALLFMMLILILGATYAFWVSNFRQTEQNVTKYNCFNVTFNGGDAAIVENGYPQLDEDGLKNPTYKVKVTNTCDTYVKFNVIYNILNNSTNNLENYMKVGIKKNSDEIKAHILTSLTKVTSTLSGAKSNAYKIDTGGLAKNESATYEVNTWMKDDTPEATGANTKFNFIGC